MFEVQDLLQASPATVSRCGMVYIDSNQLGWEPVVDTWCYFFKEKNLDMSAEMIAANTHPLCVQVNNLVTRFKDLFADQYTFLRKECKEIIPSSDVNLCQSFLNLTTVMFNSLVDFAGGRDKLEKMEKADLELYFNLILIFSFIWSVGGNLFDGQPWNSRQKYSQFIKSKILKVFTSFPFEGDIYDYFIDFENKEFKAWNDVVPEFVYDSNVPFFNILVPTADTVKFGFVINKLINGGFNVLSLGETGVGKSIIMNEFLIKINPEVFVSSNLNFSAQTNS